MKRILKLMALVAVAAFTVTSCYDDSALQASIKELQDQMKEANSLLEKIKGGFVITSATKTDDGYTFTMSDGKTISVKNGADGADGSDGTSASVIETRLADLTVFSFGESKDVPVTVTGVSIIDAFAPAGWSASVEEGILSVRAPKSSDAAARKGSVVVVATGGNSLVLMTVAVALNILDVNGAYWDALIDDPQYGGDLLYGPMDPETYTYNVEYTWADPVTKLAFNGFGSNWGSVSFSSGGEAISNYVEPDFKDAGYLRQLEIPAAPANGSNFIVHFGAEDAPNGLAFADGEARTIESIDCIMTNYLANSTIFGDGYFGPLAGDSFVAVKATGYDAEGNETATLSKVLISGDEVAAYADGKAIEWSTWDLSGLGEVVSVKFAVYGSEDCYGDWGFNAPAYFAYCDVVVKQ
ncbi:MAG: DUF4465 domain-containing protein [Bacteroidales bacterium]|nr:DUF4465 domain-containing protein [Bacteroidales bacterium]